MKLVIRQYLASLRERGELDAILPDLLSQLGLTVFSRPARGTRQDGVDVGAVGRLEDGDEKVYLFLIKAGDLTRTDWQGDPQALHPSLTAALEVYPRNRLPVEHRAKPKVICICLGGDVREEVRPDLRAFVDRYSSSEVSFEEWNGDKLAALIEGSLLREELLPDDSRSRLRKSLALLDQPGSSFTHFRALIRSLAEPRKKTKQQITAIRQMSLCLWILFAWCRDAENTEAAFLAGEFTLLHGWAICSKFAGKKTKVANSVQMAFQSILHVYQEICSDFFMGDVLPHVSKLHGLSTAVRSSCSLDVNLKLFDLVGRLGVAGLWTLWLANRSTEVQAKEKAQLLKEARGLGDAIKAMIENNPALLLPVTEDQAIEVAIVLLFLAYCEGNATYIRGWLREILRRAGVALRSHWQYPCSLRAYGDLLGHPRRQDDGYRKEVTAGSILYPLIAVWAALLDEHETYAEVGALKREVLGHCTFQYWFPDEITEKHLYTGDGRHGAALLDVCVDRPAADFLDQLFSECEASQHFENLSAVKFGWWPLVVVACRHHRLPLPLHFLKSLRRTPADSAGGQAPDDGVRI